MNTKNKKDKQYVPKTPTLDVLMTKREVCVALNVTEKTIDKMLREGRLPEPIRYNRKLIRWRKSQIDAYINSL